MRDFPHDSEYTVKEIRDIYTERLNNIIDLLLDANPKETKNNMIIFAYHAVPDVLFEEGDLLFAIIDEENLDKNYPSTFEDIVAPIEEVAGYYVSDAYTTQHYLADMICFVLNELLIISGEEKNIQKQLGIIDETYATDAASVEEMYQKAIKESGFVPEKRDREEENEENRIRNMIKDHNEKNMVREIQKTSDAIFMDYVMNHNSSKKM